MPSVDDIVADAQAIINEWGLTTPGSRMDVFLKSEIYEVARQTGNATDTALVIIDIHGLIIDDALDKETP